MTVKRPRGYVKTIGEPIWGVYRSEFVPGGCRTQRVFPLFIGTIHANTKHTFPFRALPSYGLSYIGQTRPAPYHQESIEQARADDGGEPEHRKGARGKQRTAGAGKHNHLTWKPTRTKSTRMLSRTLVWAPTDSGVFTLTGLSRVEGPPD